MGVANGCWEIKVGVVFHFAEKSSTVHGLVKTSSLGLLLKALVTSNKLCMRKLTEEIGAVGGSQNSLFRGISKTG